MILPKKQQLESGESVLTTGLTPVAKPNSALNPNRKKNNGVATATPPEPQPEKNSGVAMRDAASMFVLLCKIYKNYRNYL